MKIKSEKKQKSSLHANAVRECVYQHLDYTGWPQNSTVFVHLNFVKY